MIGVKTEMGRCQVRSRTDHPCHCPAVVELQGVPFCERCAREQEAYFTIGELTQGAAGRKSRTPRHRSLVAMLDRMRWELTGHAEGKEKLLMKRGA